MESNGQFARLRPWIKNVEGHYVKENWSMVPTTNESQSFNDGELKLLFEMALYDPMRWTWADDPPDPMHLAGWKAATLGQS